MRINLRMSLIGLCLVATLSPLGVLAASRKPAKDEIDFNRDIRPIFSENCYACHGPDKNKRKAGLRLDIKEEAFKKQESGDYIIVPKNVKKSKLLALTPSQDEDDRMPPSKFGNGLTKDQPTLLRR